MKIKQIRAKNYVKFDDFELTFNNEVTRLVGINGSGKTTVGLKLLWAGFKGIAEKSKTDQLIGERFRFIADGKKSLDIEILLHDELTGNEIIIKRHITKTLNQLSFKSKDGRELSKEYIENLFNVTFLSASHFTSLTGKEQALALGINTDKFDKEISDIKSDAQALRKQIKAIGEVEEMKKVEKISLTVLNSKRDTMVAENKIQSDLIIEILNRKGAIDNLTRDIKESQEALSRLKIELEKKDIPGEKQDISHLDIQIRNVENINEEASIYENNLIKLNNKKDAEGDLEKVISSQESKSSERLEYIKSATFGMKGLAIDDTGSLLLDDRPIRSPYYSMGELEMIVAQIGAGLNPEFKVRFIDNFELLDDDNQKKLIDKLTQKGYQIITAEVGNEKKSDNTVLLRECKIVKD